MSGALYFVADTPSHGAELWQLPAGDATPSMLRDLFPGTAGSHPAELTVLGDTLYFIAETPDTPPCIWAFTASDNRILLANPNEAALSRPHSLTAWNSILFFVATHSNHGEELWCLRPPYAAPRAPARHLSREM